MSSKQAQDMAGLRCFLNELYELLELKVEDVKMIENEAFVSCGGCDSVGGDSGGWWWL